MNQLTAPRDRSFRTPSVTLLARVVYEAPPRPPLNTRTYVMLLVLLAGSLSTLFLGPPLPVAGIAWLAFGAWLLVTDRRSAHPAEAPGST